MPQTIETARLSLRSFTPADAPLLHELDSDPAVLRYLGARTSTTIEAYADHIANVYQRYDQTYECLGFWAVIERTNHDFLGWACLRPAMDHRFAHEAGYQEGDAELGYRLKAATWGHGYATEAALAIIAHALRVETCARIVASALVENRASTRVMEKCGMSPVAEFQLAGYSCPGVTYARPWRDFPV